MDLTKDQTVKLIVFSLILGIGLLVYYRMKTGNIEGLQAQSIPVDAENPDLRTEQIYGIVPAAASASIFMKKDARDKANNLDNLPFDKNTGNYTIETVNIDLNPDPNDIQNILQQRGIKEGFTTSTAILSQAAADEAQNFVLEKAQERAAQSKVGQKVGNFAIKAINKTNQAVSKKLGGRVGPKLAQKLASKAASKIASLIGKRAAIATTTGATQTALPDPTSISQFFGIVLTVIGVAGLAAQVAINEVLKGEEGFCPAGFERLNGAIPSFMTKVPGIGDILEVMGPYVCYRNACEPNEDEDAGLCYDKCDKGYKGVGPVCWANSNDVGVGQLKECPPGWTNDGLTCREPISCDPVRWDGCCRRGAWGECWGCARGGSCRGGTVKGRAAGSNLPCPKSHPNEITGLCYRNCPSDTPNRVAGMPYLCSAAASVGDGRGKTSYGRGVGRPKLKMRAVEKNPTPEPAPPAASSSNSFGNDPNTNCRADFAATNLLNDMCKFYYKSAAKTPETVSNGLRITYISRISKVIASSEQSCDVLCDLTTIVLANATSKTPLSSTTVKDKTRRFYFAKVTSTRTIPATKTTPARTETTCRFIPTAATNVDDTGKEINNPDMTPVSLNFVYNPFV